jgi:hypothetical protein
LCVAWPAIQVAEQGSGFLGQFFWSQMIERFTPNNPFEADATIASLRWLSGEDAALTALGIGSAAAVLAMRRFRTAVPVRSLAVLIAITVVALTFAGGNINQRYLLILLPLLATVGACVLVELLPRPGYAAMVSAAVFASSLPWLVTIPEDSNPFARSDLIDISRRYKELALGNENPVFVVSPLDHPPTNVALAFCYHAELSRLVWIRHNRLRSLEGRASRVGLAPPFSGIVHSDYFPDVETVLGPVVKVAQEGSYLIWRQTAPEQP